MLTGENSRLRIAASKITKRSLDFRGFPIPEVNRGLLSRDPLNCDPADAREVVFQNALTLDVGYHASKAARYVLSLPLEVGIALCGPDSVFAVLFVHRG